jgi:nucleoside transporter
MVKRNIQIRLSLMMFIQYFVLGATMPIFSLYLKDTLHFSGSEMGIVMAMANVAYLFSPFMTAFIADRIVSAERLLGLSHLAGGIIMFVFLNQKEFYPALLLYLAYTFLIGPTSALTNAITFHQDREKNKIFGNVRVWGTIGWMVVAWVFGLMWFNKTSSAAYLPIALQISAVSSFILGIYAFTLPRAFTRLEKQKSFLTVESFKVLLLPQMVLFTLFSMVINLVDRFYYFGMAPFLKQTGFSTQSIMPVMSIGQVPEIFAMALIGIFMKKYGFKKALILGIIMEIARFSIFSSGVLVPLTVAGIGLHGLAYTFYFITASIYLDKFCSKKARTGAHQLFSLITFGIGGFLGNVLAGWTADLFAVKPAGLINFHLFWAIPLLLSVISLIGIGIFINEKKNIKVDEIAVKADDPVK